MKIKIILMCMMVFFITGCWNYNELNELAIVNGVGIDTKDGEYLVSLMVSNGLPSNSNSKEGESSTTLLKGTGKTITDAINSIEENASKYLYFAHMNVLLISEDIAYESLYPIVDAFFRNPETIKRYQIVIAKDCKAYDALRLLSPIETYPSQNIAANISEGKNTLGFSAETILSEFLFKSINEGTDPTIPSITISGDINDANDTEDLNETYIPTFLKLDTVAVFKNYKLINYATKDESKGINLLTKKTKSFTITNKCYKDEDKYIVTKLDDLNASFKIKDNKVIFSIKGSGSINETNCKLDLTSPKVIEKINKTVNNNLEEIIDEAVIFSVDNNVDIFGLSFIAKRKKVKFKLNDFEYDIKVDIELKTKGSLENTIKEQQDEK